jgi:hypothetical protein
VIKFPDTSHYILIVGIGQFQIPVNRSSSQAR